MDRLIGVLGLAVLLGLAWAFSKHRNAVRPRTVVLGVSLQLLLAVIILKSGLVSFLGMSLLVSLIVFYLLGPALASRFGGAPPAAVVAVITTAALIAAGRSLEPSGATTVLVVLAVLVWLAGFLLHRPELVRGGFAALLPLGIGLLWARGADGRVVFQALSDQVAAFLGLSNQGAEFMFGNLAKGEYFNPADTTFWPGFGPQFAFSVLPTIIFFSAFMAVMYHLGIVQVVVAAMARFMHWSLKTSGSETTSVSANVFVGQTESPFLIRPFLPEMTVSELHAVMVGGFATVAGGVLAGYVQMGVSPGHLIAASVMSAPAALVIAKLLYPETEESKTAGDVEIPNVKAADNLVGAATAGTTDGLKLALNVAAMLIAFIALIAVVDWVLAFVDLWIDGQLLGGVAQASGEFRGIVPGSMKTFFGTLLSPLAWLMGVPWKDALAVGNLLGIKLAVNEFVAYGFLAEHIAAADLDERSTTIATYALCGFANVSSIGIQIGGIGVLAPERRSDLARVGVRAMCGGAMASFMTACVAGILL